MNHQESEMDVPLATIITPTYNSNPQFLKEAIESVLKQTYPRIEYIISDDGSREFPEEMVREILATKNRGNIEWKIIKNERNVGTVKNINGAIRESRGEYVFMIAHDDTYYDNEVINEWVQEFQRTGALVITANMYIQDINQTSPSPKERKVLQSPPWLKLILQTQNIISAPATAQSRKCFQKYGLYDETYTLLEDYPRWIHLVNNNVNIRHWNHVVTTYRFGGVSSSINPILGKDEVLLYKRIYMSEQGLRKLILFIHYRLQYLKQLIRLRLSDDERMIGLNNCLYRIITLIQLIYVHVIAVFINPLWKS